MFSLQKTTTRLYPSCIGIAKMSQVGDLGSGAGRGGGGGGSIRAAGGAFGIREAAQEEEYFHRKQAELLRNLKHDQIDQVEFHKKQVEELEAAIKRHKDSLEKLQK